MSRILTTVLSLHWMVVFALLAWTGGGTLFGGPVLLGFEFPELLRRFDIVLPIGFGLVAVLFLWLLVSAMLERHPQGRETQEVARIAFASAALVLTLVVSLASLRSSAGVALQLAALLSSWLAIGAELRSAVGAEQPPVSVLSVKAFGAARETMLGRPRRPGAGEVLR